jgi:hypothetical protein
MVQPLHTVDNLAYIPLTSLTYKLYQSCIYNKFIVIREIANEAKKLSLNEFGPPVRNIFQPKLHINLGAKFNLFWICMSKVNEL